MEQLNYTFTTINKYLNNMIPASEVSVAQLLALQPSSQTANPMADQVQVIGRNQDNQLCVSTTFSDWPEVMQAIRQGVAPGLFPIGTRLPVPLVHINYSYIQITSTDTSVVNTEWSSYIEVMDYLDSTTMLCSFITPVSTSLPLCANNYPANETSTMWVAGWSGSFAYHALYQQPAEDSYYYDATGNSMNINVQNQCRALAALHDSLLQAPYSTYVHPSYLNTEMTAAMYWVPSFELLQSYLQFSNLLSDNALYYGLASSNAQGAIFTTTQVADTNGTMRMRDWFLLSSQPTGQWQVRDKVTNQYRQTRLFFILQ